MKITRIETVLVGHGWNNLLITRLHTRQWPDGHRRGHDAVAGQNGALFCRAAGGGPIHDVGPYFIGAPIQRLGPIGEARVRGFRGLESRTVTAEGRERGMIIPVETLTTVFALRRFRSGVEATLSASWDVWKASQPAIEIHGTKGSSQLPHPAWRHGPLRFAGPGGDWQAVAVDDNALTEANWPPDTPSSSNYRGIGLAEMIDAMETGCPHRTPADLATHVVEVADAIIASTTTDTVVSVTSAPQHPAPLDARDISRLISPMP